MMNVRPVSSTFDHTDLRRSRSAITYINPVVADLVRGIERILPGLTGNFDE